MSKIWSLRWIQMWSEIFFFLPTDESERSKNTKAPSPVNNADGADDERATGTDSAVVGIHFNCGAFSCYLSFSGDLLRRRWLLWSTRVSSSASSPTICSLLFQSLCISCWSYLTRNFIVGFLRVLMLRKSRKLTINCRWNSELFCCFYYFSCLSVHDKLFSKFFWTFFNWGFLFYLFFF